MLDDRAEVQTRTQPVVLFFQEIVDLPDARIERFSLKSAWFKEGLLHTL